MSCERFVEAPHDPVDAQLRPTAKRLTTLHERRKRRGHLRSVVGFVLSHGVRKIICQKIRLSMDSGWVVAGKGLNQDSKRGSEQCVFEQANIVDKLDLKWQSFPENPPMWTRPTPFQSAKAYHHKESSHLSEGKVTFSPGGQTSHCRSIREY